MSYTPDVSMFPYFKNTLKIENEFYKNGFIELCEEYEGDGEWSFAEVKYWIDNLNEENEALKIKNDKQTSTDKMTFSISFTEEQSWYEENYEVENANEIKTEDLEECEYKNMRSTFDLFEELKELKTEYNRIEPLYDSCKKYIDIFQSRCGYIHNKFVCSNRIVDDEYIEERLKMNDNIDLEMASLFKQIKKLKEQNKELELLEYERDEENKKLKEQNKELELLQKDISRQLEYKECLNYTDWKDEWMEENLDINDVGNASIKISNYQDDMEENMVEYFNENKDDMMENLKNEWLKVFMEDSICEDDIVENCDDVGVLYDNIKEYFIHSLDVDEDDISNWENDVDSDGESDEED